MKTTQITWKQKLTIACIALSLVSGTSFLAARGGGEHGGGDHGGDHGGGGGGGGDHGDKGSYGGDHPSWCDIDENCNGWKAGIFRVSHGGQTFEQAFGPQYAAKRPGFYDPDAGRPQAHLNRPAVVYYKPVIHKAVHVRHYVGEPMNLLPERVVGLFTE
jgi:hypothetical protein